MERFHYYRSELKSKHILKYKMIGIVSEIILSKSVFPKNQDIGQFIKTIFNTTFKDYVIGSRTTILARTTRIIYLSEEQEYEEYRKKLLEFVSSISDKDEKNVNTKSRSESFTKWVKGIKES